MKPKKNKANVGTKSTAAYTGAQRRTPKAPMEAHTNKSFTKNNPFKVRAVGGAATPPKPGGGRPQGGGSKSRKRKTNRGR